MKLHLPKLLCAAVMVAMGLAQADDSLYINVGQAQYDKVSKNLVSCDSSYMEDSTINVGNKALKIGDGDLVGYFSETDSVTGEPVVDSYKTSFQTTNSGSVGSIVVSKSFKVNGDLEISGSGKVYIGGKSSGNFYSYLEAKNVTIDGTGDNLKSNGATSESVQECANLNLRADSAQLDSLTMKGGAAFLCTYESGGGDDTWGLGPNTSDSCKSVYIKNGLKVEAGYLQMGYNSTSGNINLVNKHFRTFLGGTIEQDGGTILVNGKVYLDGSSITQKGGKMTLANNTSVERLVISKNSFKIEQVTNNGKEGNPELIISGAIASTGLTNSSKGDSARKLEISQQCEGTITIKNGVLFKSNTSTGASTINQSGGGTIDLSGDFTSADFTVTQTKGTININQNGKMALVGTNDVGGTLVNSGTLTIADVNVIGTLVNNGTMTISGKATISGKFVNNTDSLTATKLNLVEGGVFENNGTWEMSSGDLNAGTIAGTGTYVSQSDLTLTEGTLQLTLADISDSSPSTFEGTLLNVNSNTLVVDSNVTIALAMSGDVETLFRTMLANQADTPVEFTMLVAENVSNWQNLDTAALADQTEHSAYISGVSYSARDGKVYVSGKLIPEPTTATLSLMALAALAARRRRK